MTPRAYQQVDVFTRIPYLGNALGVVMDGKLTAEWPVKDDALTLISLKDGKVASIAYAADDAAIHRALGLPAP